MGRIKLSVKMVISKKLTFKNYKGLARAVGVLIFVAVFGLIGIRLLMPGHAATVQAVAGQNYEICSDQSQLTSPWTYHGLASGTQSYTVAQYEALSGYGTTLPLLPSYISSQSSSTMAAEIFAPGSNVSQPAYAFPETPLLYFFEGGAYGELAMSSISGDEFIGGSTTGFPEPTFDNGGDAGGIDAGNGSHYFSGGASTLAATANVGATTITTASAIPGYIQFVTFSDGSTYSISNASGTTITLDNPLTSSEASGSAVWANSEAPLAYVSASAVQGATSFSVSSSTIPLVPYAQIRIGDDAYQLTSTSG